MGTGQFIRRGVSVSVPQVGNVLVTTGRFLPENLAQKINSISAFNQRYRTRTLQKDLTKQQYRMVLVFVTLLIIFAAVWIGFHIARSITVPVEKLAQATKAVSRGDLSVRVEDPVSDELGMLIESFNQMIADLKTGRESLEQKTAEQEARKQYIETILNSVNTGVLALDAESVIGAVNPAARTLLGLPSENVVGRPVADILGGPRYRDLLSAIDSAMKTRHRLAEKEIPLLLNGQQMTIALTLMPFKTPGRDFAGMIVVLDDLTQLIKAQKIAAWKEVAQRVAHEIKNPLTPIQLNAERIIKTLKRTEPGGAEVLEQGAKVIIEEAQTIKSLVDEFSDFARLPKTNIQPARLHDIVRQVVAMFRGIYADVLFDVNLSPAVPDEISLDPEQIKRALINLIDNAIDAMSKKGRIELRTIYEAESGQVRIEVADSGPGITAEDKEKLFVPHVSTKKKGTGLGLAIVSQIVKEHNGRIEVQDNRPTGAKFTLRIPV
jgi:two-component system nitrogen regulation sensor histidine kinase NtrY